MCKHENKTCPLCNAIFECKVGDITKCQCYTVKLTDAERDFLTHTYNDCLCASCVQAVRTAYNQALEKARLKRLSGDR